MPLTRGAADLLDRLEALRHTLRTEESYILDEVRKLADVAAGNKEATLKVARNIQIALGNIHRAEQDIDKLIREELRPRLSRKGRDEQQKDAEIEARIAGLERRIEELSRPKPGNVAEFRRKEGQAK
jgi:hypothetical protein